MAWSLIWCAAAPFRGRCCQLKRKSGWSVVSCVSLRAEKCGVQQLKRGAVAVWEGSSCVLLGRPPLCSPSPRPPLWSQAQQEGGVVRSNGSHAESAARKWCTEPVIIDLIIGIVLHCARPDRIGVRSQWALGMLLYQLLSGTLPFWDEGESQSPFTVMTAILGGEVTFDGPTWDAISPLGRVSLASPYPTPC